MSDPIVKKILDTISWTQNRMIRETSNLTEAEFCQQPSLAAPPIGWHVWHIARWADMLQASMTDQQEHWEQAELVVKFGLNPTKLGLLQMGSIQSPQEAADVISTMGQERLLEYARSSFDMTDAALKELALADLYTPRESILRIDWNATPFTEGKGADVVLVEDLNFHSTHSQRHLGMIEALIGAMLNREGTATI
ncbi:MAG: DinB family protein [Candidatus Promineifilaceae bacterium]|nr:DinB family protein [Candidatus Promineifilaceae bacterium]